MLLSRWSPPFLVGVMVVGGASKGLVRLKFRMQFSKFLRGSSVACRERLISPTDLLSATSGLPCLLDSTRLALLTTQKNTKTALPVPRARAAAGGVKGGGRSEKPRTQKGGSAAKASGGPAPKASIKAKAQPKHAAAAGKPKSAAPAGKKKSGPLEVKYSVVRVSILGVNAKRRRKQQGGTEQGGTEQGWYIHVGAKKRAKPAARWAQTPAAHHHRRRDAGS